MTTSTYNHPRHPAWLQVWLYAMDHDGRTLDPGELRDACGLDQRTLSRGLRQARVMGLLSTDSNARHLVVIHLPRGTHIVRTPAEGVGTTDALKGADGSRTPCCGVRSA